MEKITDSSGNVFNDLGFSPEESAIYTLRAELMASLRKTIREREWTQEEAAKALSIGQSRVSDLMRGKWEKFSLDMLIILATRAGRHVQLAIV
ncbi:MAG: XRE family transcriptional regulator [Nitrosomonas sp.]|nr:XRE family transcriptional regulator [Nitrosomonas sp.]MCW5606440.1 XRE family transcriptional regulator [Nitrosomonas sp.]